MSAPTERRSGERGEGKDKERASERERERERRREGEWCNERESGGERRFKEASLPQQCLSALAVKCADKTAHFVDTKHCE